MFFKYLFSFVLLFTSLYSFDSKYANSLTSISFSKNIHLTELVDTLNYTIKIENRNKTKTTTIKNVDKLKSHFDNLISKEEEIKVNNSHYRTYPNNKHYKGKYIVEGYTTEQIYLIKSKNYKLLNSIINKIKLNNNFYITNKNYSISQKKMAFIKNNKLKLILPKLLQDEKKYSKLIKGICKYSNISFNNRNINYQHTSSKSLFPSTLKSSSMIDLKEDKELTFFVNLTMVCNRD